jgi:hypothetical protein
MEHQMELIMSKERIMLQRELKENFWNTEGQWKGLSNKTFDNAWSTKHCVEQNEALHAQSMLIYLYMPMPIEPHSMGLFLKFINIIWCKQLQDKIIKDWNP